MPAIDRLRQPLVCLALAGFASLSQAAFVTYASRDAFIGATFAARTDGFDDLAAGDLASSLTRSAAPYGYSVASPSGLFGAGAADRWLSNFDRRESITFSGFGGGVEAIGGSFFGSSEDGSAHIDQMLTITVRDVAMNELSTLLTANSATSFFGVVSTLPILSVVLAVDPGNLLASYPTVNNFVVAVVPEPATGALLIAGLALAAAAGRRRPKA